MRHQRRQLRASGDVRNIYEENSERAYAIARQVDRPDAEAIFLSGVGMPTLDALQLLEEDTGKPVISAASAMMWHALRTAGIRHKCRALGGCWAEISPNSAAARQVHRHHLVSELFHCKTGNLAPAK